jgi:hypothetical protein
VCKCGALICWGRRRELTDCDVQWKKEIRCIRVLRLDVLGLRSGLFRKGRWSHCLLLTPRAGHGPVAACHTHLATPLNWIYQLYNICPTEFLIQTIFYNSAYVPCLFRVTINWRSNVANRKIPNYSVSLFCFVPNPNGFSLDRSRNFPQIPNFSLW